MLLAQAFMKLIRCWETGELAPPDSELLRNQVVLLVVRSLVRILLTQSSDGSWGSRGPCEETAYAILTLEELAGLPIASFLDQQIRSALLHGRSYLEAHRQVEQPEHLWVEKVLYGAQYISQAYILAALNAPEFPPMEGLRFNELLNLDYRAMSKATSVFQKVPLLASQPRWLIEASWIEGRLFLPMLQEVRKATFSRGGMTKDKYFAWIPTMWTLADNKNGTYTSTKLVYDMMRLSVLNFQVDEFMEAVLDAKHSENHSTVRNIIEDLFINHSFPGGTENRSSITHRPVLHARSISDFHSNKDIQIDKSFNNSTLEDQNTHESNANACSKVNQSISKSLQSFKNYITDIASAAGILPSTLSRIHAELKAFLLAHLTQTQMNKEFSFYKRTVAAPLSNAPLSYQNSTSPSFRTWLFSIAAIHTSCHYSFVLYFALVSAVHGGSPLLRTTSQQYVAADVCEHLAKMCRLYNDCGSLKRDLAEGNLNCVNFPGFRDEEIEDNNDQDDKEKVESDVQEKKLKARLMALADWERKGLDSAMGELERNPRTDDRLMGAMKIFVDVTDVFGQVYMVKDLASGKV